MLNPPSNPVSLKRRVLAAGSWSLAGFAAGNVVRLASSLLLTRLLVPDMFGVMGVAGIILIGLQLFSDIGLLPNIIQSPRGGDPAFLNTAWVIEILRGFVLWSAALVVSLIVLEGGRFGLFPAHSVYADPRLPYVIAVSSFTIVIGGFQSTKLLEARRNLIVGRITLIDLIAQAAGVACALAWAFADRSIWALVSNWFGLGLTKVILSHFWLPGNRNRWAWDKAAFNEIVHFGKWIFLSSALGFLAINSDRLLLGNFVSPTVLGIYFIAFNVLGMVDQMVSKLIVDLSFPALSEVSRERPDAFSKNYGQFHLAVTSVGYLCAGALMASGNTLIDLLYDPRYHDAGWMLQIISVVLLVVPFRLATQCFLVFGAPQIYSHVQGIRLIGLLLFMPAGFYLFGLPGALWGNVLSVFMSAPLIVVHMRKYGLLDLRRELLALPLVVPGLIAGELFTVAVRHFW